MRRMPFFSDILNILYFSFNLRNSKLLSTFISKNITDNKRHFYFLKRVRSILRYYLKFELAENFYGIYILVCGKFQGYLRKRKFSIKIGKPGIQRFKVSADYNLQNSYTRFGVFSIKVILTYYDKNLMKSWFLKNS